MANNYSDANGVITLREGAEWTPLIKAVFEGFELNTDYPGDGVGMIEQVSEGACADIESLMEGIDALLEKPLNEAEDGDLACVIRAFAKQKGLPERNLELENWISNMASKDVMDVIDLEEAMALINALGEGDLIESAYLSGAYTCDRNRLDEFGGFGTYIGRHVTCFSSSQQSRTDGEAIDLHLSSGDVSSAASVLTGNLINAIELVDETFQDEMEIEVAKALSGWMPNPFKDFTQQVANLSKWGCTDAETEEPSEGTDDSHSCLMDLIDDARKVIAEPGSKPTFWVLTIDNESGIQPSVHRTRDGAYQELDDYVQEWWEKELGDDPMPDDQFERIRYYFDNVEGELAEIDECEVQG